MAGSQERQEQRQSTKDKHKKTLGGDLFPKQKKNNSNNVNLLVMVSLVALVGTLGIFLANYHFWATTAHVPSSMIDYMLLPFRINSKNATSLLRPIRRVETIGSKDYDAFAEEEAGDKHGDDGDDDELPLWFIHYMDWHAQQRQTLTPQNYRKSRFLVLRCMEESQEDKICGGLSDRIKPLPLLLLLAAQTNRIFLISWSRPCPLEEFLLPPPLPPPSSPLSKAGYRFNNTSYSLDWRTPDWLIPIVVESRLVSNAKRILKAANNDDLPILCVQMHDQHGGSALYNKLMLQQQQQQQQLSTISVNDLQPEEEAYRKVYGPLFRALFVPTPPLAAALAMEQDELWGGSSHNNNNNNNNDHEGSYGAAHLRAYYNPHLTESQIQVLAVNAVLCANQLRPRVPIYFASDSKLAIDHVHQYFYSIDRNSSTSSNQRQKRPIRVMTLHRGGREALHLDQAASRKCSDYYDVFLDIFHLANAKCIAHGQGGFGRLGVLVSQNTSCFMPFIAQGRIIDCSAIDQQGSRNEW